MKEKFRKAFLLCDLGQSHEIEALSKRDADYDMPVISDELLSEFSDFPTEIWRQDTFIRKFDELLPLLHPSIAGLVY